MSSNLNSTLLLYNFKFSSCANHGNIYCNYTHAKKTRGIQWAIKQTGHSTENIIGIGIKLTITSRGTKKPQIQMKTYPMKAF